MYKYHNLNPISQVGLERMTVYVHSAGFFSSGVELKSKTGIGFSFLYLYFL